MTILCAAAHFAAAMISGIIAFGIDFDQLRFRSIASTIATYAHELLMAPHSAVVRSMPNAWLTRPGVIPVLLVTHHLKVPLYSFAVRWWGAGAKPVSSWTSVP